jgi:hypothetical protein
MTIQDRLNRIELLYKLPESRACALEVEIPFPDGCRISHFDNVII